MRWSAGHAAPGARARPHRRDLADPALGFVPDEHAERADGDAGRPLRRARSGRRDDRDAFVALLEDFARRPRCRSRPAPRSRDWRQRAARFGWPRAGAGAGARGGGRERQPQPAEAPGLGGALPAASPDRCLGLSQPGGLARARCWWWATRSPAGRWPRIWRGRDGGCSWPPAGSGGYRGATAGRISRSGWSRPGCSTRRAGLHGRRAIAARPLLGALHTISLQSLSAAGRGAARAAHRRRGRAAALRRRPGGEHPLRRRSLGRGAGARSTTTSRARYRRAGGGARSGRGGGPAAAGPADPRRSIRPTRGIGTVIWCTGFQGDFGWVRVSRRAGRPRAAAAGGGVSPVPGAPLRRAGLRLTRRSGHDPGDRRGSAAACRAPDGLGAVAGAWMMPGTCAVAQCKHRPIYLICNDKSCCW